MINGIPWWVLALWLVCLAAFAFIFLGGGPRVRIGRSDNPRVAEPLLVCPACTLVISARSVRVLEREAGAPAVTPFQKCEFEQWLIRILMLEFRVSGKYHGRLTAEQRRFDPRRLPK